MTWLKLRASVVLFAEALLAFGCGLDAWAQSNTRLLLSSGWGVPEHAGFVFGPFSSLAMNDAKEIVFLSSLRGAKSDLRAVIRSSGVTFSVVAFEGLKAPVPRASYESFSAPSLNNTGVIAFTATLKDDTPTSAVMRVEEGTARAIAVSGTNVAGTADATFEEFSAPLLTSAGNVLFGARTGGKQPATGLYFWFPGGIQSVALPAELNLKPTDLLTPVFSSHDAAVFAARGTPAQAATEQFFRVAAIKNFQDLKPPPTPGEKFEVLPARAGEAPVKMLLVLMEGQNVQTAALDGDPSQPVPARRTPGIAPKPLGRIQGQATGPRENIIFATAPADSPSDLALYCYCEGQVIRKSSPEEFLPVTQAAKGRPIFSLATDSQHAAAFVAPAGEEGDAVGIYVTSLP